MKINRGQSGYSLIELMVTMAIFLALLAALAAAMGVGQDSWPIIAADIEVREIARNTRERITREFENTGFNKDGIPEMVILEGGGPDGTDVVRFAVPILCEETQSWMNVDGEIAHWGAPLTWRCTCEPGDAQCITACMDANGDCEVIEYRFIQYVRNSSNQLLRQVLDSEGNVISSESFAEHVVDFQVDQESLCLFRFEITFTRSTLRQRVMSLTTDWKVHVRNSGNGRCSP